MHYFVVAGALGSRKYAGVLLVAEYLEKKYPFIIFHRIYVKSNNWKEWLKSITNKNGWNHFSLPIIWREIPFRGGKKCLVGGYNCFMEYCCEVYNVDVSFATATLKRLSIQMFIKEIQNEELLRIHNVLPQHICIYGAGSALVPLFLPLLLHTPGLANYNGLVLELYDEDISKRNLLEGIVEDFGCIVPKNSCNAYFTAHVTNNIITTMKNCDLFILIIPKFHDLNNENKECWSQALSFVTRAGNTLAFVAKEKIRVIIVSESYDTPICLCAAAFAQAAMPNVISQNVVAVTAGIGIMIRSMLAYSLQVPLHLVNEVPVWGFIGVSHMVSPSLTLPNDNLNYSEIAQKFQTNPTFKNEFLDSYLWPLFGRRKETMEIMLKRNPYWATVEAMIEIVHKWYSEDSIGNQACLGIYSDGTFGIPPGIYFSQPSILTDGIWKPFQGHSLPVDQFCTIDDLCNTAVLLTEIYLNKEKLRYILTGLNIEADYSYFTNEEVNFNVKLNSQDNTITIAEYEIYEENHYIIAALVKETIQNILNEKQLASLIPCLFSFDDGIDFITAVVKKSMSKILADMHLETLIPCLFPDDVDFVIIVMNDLINGSLINLQRQELIPCILPLTEKENFEM